MDLAGALVQFDIANIPNATSLTSLYDALIIEHAGDAPKIKLINESYSILMDETVQQTTSTADKIIGIRYQNNGTKVSGSALIRRNN